MTEHEYNKAVKDKYYSWMSDDQFECFELLCDLFGGAHHISGAVRECGTGIRVSERINGFATFDFGRLTEFVLLCHDRCIRGEIENSSPGRIGLVLHKRHSREGRIYARHPTIEEAIQAFRKRSA